MKNLLMLSFLFISCSILAQPALSDEIRPRHEHEVPQFTPEQMASLKAKELTLMLDLNQVQQKKVEALELEVATDRHARHEKRKLDEKKTDEDLFKARSEHLDNQIVYKNKMKSILSEEQFQKWEKSHIARAKKTHPKKHHSQKRGEWH
jgi:hypothetical protein